MKNPITKCPVCKAEMIPGFMPTTFYCPNDCDLKKGEKLNLDEMMNDGYSPDWDEAGLWVIPGQAVARSRNLMWICHNFSGKSFFFTKAQIASIKAEVAAYGHDMDDVIKVDGIFDVACDTIIVRVEFPLSTLELNIPI